ncbi:predicted protein [Scheffersomyces stipitis CBS 6054]|uniref:HRQ family protein 1 n=1 Tax=Scheffersomyces stipitis (strain ATCC 58785 / CBS 6054 / NBRC 10063 / NRRL Y-11545) TaxID=322104 RepID=A3LXD6_PICST|nr:predicted protein [Scheffersomyces stipitis CBS 6054]ABN67788.2 predicted protein [Scheffersomyces stipitis CBS 6054]
MEANASFADGGLLVSLYKQQYVAYSNLTNGSSETSFNILLASIVVSVLALIVRNQKNSKNKNSAALKPKKANIINRVWGKWTPDYDFKTPTPEPFKYWDFKKTKPMPYRAFKHKYTVTMGIRNMEWDSWIELDNQWLRYHNNKLDRFKERGDELYATSPLATAAAYELLDEFKRYLPARYPALFKATDIGMDNLETGESYDFRPGHHDDPMKLAAMFTQDDLAIMIEHEDGNYSLEAGAIALAGFWRLRDKFQMKLNEIHTSGDVPKYETNLKMGMTKFFRRLTVDKPVVRNNYFIQTDDNLGWSDSIGREDVEEIGGWYTAKVASEIDKLYFRSERQSLRRLPISGGVVFTIRTYFIPITELCDEPHIPRRLLNGINSWSDDVEEYRGYHKYKDILLPYLEKRAEEQEKEGLGSEPEVYPF